MASPAHLGRLSRKRDPVGYLMESLETRRLLSGLALPLITSGPVAHVALVPAIASLVAGSEAAVARTSRLSQEVRPLETAVVSPNVLPIRALADALASATGSVLGAAGSVSAVPALASPLGAVVPSLVGPSLSSGMASLSGPLSVDSLETAAAGSVAAIVKTLGVDIAVLVSTSRSVLSVDSGQPFLGARQASPAPVAASQSVEGGGPGQGFTDAVTRTPQAGTPGTSSNLAGVSLPARSANNSGPSSAARGDNVTDSVRGPVEKTLSSDDEAAVPMALSAGDAAALEQALARIVEQLGAGSLVAVDWAPQLDELALIFAAAAAAYSLARRNRTQASPVERDESAPRRTAGLTRRPGPLDPAFS